MELDDEYDVGEQRDSELAHEVNVFVNANDVAVDYIVVELWVLPRVHSVMEILLMDDADRVLEIDFEMSNLYVVEQVVADQWMVDYSVAVWEEHSQPLYSSAERVD